jgi:uncharacterized coiled-coil protein SlyX
MHWRLFKSNVEKLDKILGKEIYVEKLQPLYINKTIGKEYDIFLNILHRNQKDNEIMNEDKCYINKIENNNNEIVLKSKDNNKKLNESLKNIENIKLNLLDKIKINEKLTTKLAEKEEIIQDLNFIINENNEKISHFLSQSNLLDDNLKKLKNN